MYKFSSVIIILAFGTCLVLGLVYATPDDPVTGFVCGLTFAAYGVLIYVLSKR